MCIRDSSSNYANIKPADTSETSDTSDTSEAKDKAFTIGRWFTGTAVGLGSLWMTCIVGLVICFALTDGGCSVASSTVLGGEPLSLAIMFGFGLFLVCVAAIGNVLFHNSGYTIVSSEKTNHNNQLDSIWVASTATLCLTVGAVVGALGSR